MIQRILTHRQERAVVQILGTPSHEEARRRVGASKSTFYAWLRDPLFQAELQYQRESVYREAIARLKGEVGEAINGLVLLMEDSNPAIRRLACKDVLEYALKTDELLKFDERLRALEQAE